MSRDVTKQELIKAVADLLLTRWSLHLVQASNRHLENCSLRDYLGCLATFHRADCMGNQRYEKEPSSSVTQLSERRNHFSLAHAAGAQNFVTFLCSSYRTAYFSHTLKLPQRLLVSANSPQFIEKARVFKKGNEARLIQTFSSDMYSLKVKRLLQKCSGYTNKI